MSSNIAQTFHLRWQAALRRAVAEEMRSLGYRWSQIAHQLGMKIGSARQILKKRHEPLSDGEKACSTCKQTKPRTEFHVERRKSDGRMSSCAACVAARQREIYKDPERAPRRRSQHQRWNKTKQGRATNKVAVLEYRDAPENQHKLRAHYLVRLAVNRGELKKSPCATCGATARRVEAHHDDYSKPLEVRWLCRRCHDHEHRKVSE